MKTLTRRPLLLAFIILMAGITLARYAPPPLSAPLRVVFTRNHLNVPAPGTSEPQTLDCRVAEAAVARSGNTRVVAVARVDGRNTRIMLYFDARNQLRAGDRITVTAALEALSFPRNPGGYDEFMYLHARGIDYKMFPKDYAVTGAYHTPLTWLKNLNASAAMLLDKRYPKDAAGVMRAMLLGDQTMMDEDVAKLYQDAGIYHILTVSGLHVSIIALAVRWLLARFKLNGRVSGGVLLAALIIYCLFTGAATSTVRAVVMAGVVILADIAGRKPDFLSAASLAGVLLLLYEPLYLWDVGFLYSFSAIFGLALLTSPVAALFERFVRDSKIRAFCVKYLAGCVAAFAATLPVSVFFFYKISPVSIFVNALLIPSMLVTTLAGFLSFVFPPAAGVAWALLTLYRFVCDAAARLPFAVLLTGRPPLWAVACFAAALLLWAHPVKRLGAALCLGCAALGIAAWGGARVYEDAAWRVTMLDVGQGDATAFRYHGRVMLIDGGGNFLKELGDNTGRWVLSPYLDYLGAAKADAAFLTHMDADHALGLVELLRMGRVKSLYLGDVAYAAAEDGASAYTDANLLALILDAARQGRCPVTYIKAGDAFSFAGGVAVTCLSPPQGLSARTNNQSLILKLTDGRVSMLFTGDAESGAEARLLAEGADLRADVLKVGHHGSKTSSTAAFLEAVSPGAAIIGVSAKNVYGHPHPTVTARLDAVGARIYTTANDGAITLDTRGGLLRVATMREAK